MMRCLADEPWCFVGRVRWVLALVAAALQAAVLAGCVSTILHYPEDDDGGLLPDGARLRNDDGGTAREQDGSMPPDLRDGGMPGEDAQPARDAAPPQTDAGPIGPQPGDGVEWLQFTPLNSRTGSSWGAVLTDVAQHIPEEQLSIYWDSDPVTAGHETTHSIHAYLRNYRNTTGTRANGFYVLEDRAVIVREPGIRKSQVASYVPTELRGYRFSLYITGQAEWDDTPLYVFDEWNAYVNGTAVAVDLATSGRWTYGWQDACMGTLEFVIYSLAVGMAVKDKDASYFASYRQFREFLAWNLRRSMQTYTACAVLPDFAWDEQDRLLAALRTSSAAEAMRAFARETFGAAFTNEVLGF